MGKPSIYDAILISVTLSRLLGVFPVFVSGTGRRRTARTNRPCTYVVIFHCCLFTLIAYLANLEDNPITEGTMYNFNTLAKLLILVVTAVGVTATYAIFYLSYRYKSKYSDVINTISEVDAILARLGQSFDYKRHLFVDVAVNLGGPLFIFATITMEMINAPKEDLPRFPAVMVFCHVFPFMLVHFGESQFVITNIILHERFAALNRALRKLNDGQCAVEQKKIAGLGDLIKHGNSREKALDSCLRCHDKLCDICDVANRIFGFMIIVGCLIQFNTIVFAFCYCYYAISTRPISTLGWFFWTLFRIYELARKSISAHVSAGEAESTVQWINKLMIRSSGYAEEKLRIFALQLVHRKVTFSALGLFPLDGTFGFTVIAAATIYITIIYQFQINKQAC